jgi:hypothetical protein
MGHRLGKIWVFDEEALEKGLRAYEREAIERYPNQAERIGITLAAVRDFLHSEHAASMVMKGTPEGPAERADATAVPAPAGAGPRR